MPGRSGGKGLVSLALEKEKDPFGFECMRPPGYEPVLWGGPSPLLTGVERHFSISIVKHL